MKFMPRFSLRWTIARRIALAFTVMGSIMAILVVLTISGTRRAGDLVVRTFDDFVVTTSFARAAVADFDRMRAEFAENHNSKSPTIAILHKSFRADLSTALEKLPTKAMTQIGESLRQAEMDWLSKARQINERGVASAKESAKDIEDLDAIARSVEAKIEVLVGIVGDAAFESRQSAGATISQNTLITLGSAAVGVMMLALAGLLLHSRIRLPIAQAVQFAKDISEGRLEGQAPNADNDEIGDLTKAMTSMRGDIRRMMDEQTVLRESSQARVAEALDSSDEGVIVADGTGLIQIANARAMDFLGLADRTLPQGTTLDGLRRLVGLQEEARQTLLGAVDENPETCQTILPDGRQIRNSRSRTSESGFVGLYTDVTTAVSQTERLAAANASLDAALANMSQGLCLFDADNRLKLANPQCFELLNIDPAGAPTGTPYMDLLDLSIGAGNHPTIDPERVRAHERLMIARGRRTTRFINFRGSKIIAITHEPMPDGGWLATYEDVTERRQAEARIAYMANHDALTGLPNRSMLASKVGEALSRAAAGTSFAMLCLDLDHFKEINDLLGHAAGDALLEIVARRLKACTSRFDTVARLGGDEFAVLQANVVSKQQTEILAHRIVNAIAEPFDLGGSRQTVGSSIGIAIATQDGDNYGQLLMHADVALYKAKEEGRGRWRFFSASMEQEIKARRAMESDLKRALGANEFQLHYQPLLNVATMGIGSFEALLRWVHPVHGTVSPADFIPVAEEVGIINEIGAWVLERACEQAARWPANIKVAVNVSIVQLRDGTFLDKVVHALSASGLPAQRLELEITESVFMTNNAKAMENLKALKSLGISFAMDDFGTGYSSLSYLTKFAFDKIKIDQSFLRNLLESEEETQIVRTIVALGKGLGMRVTAEGVETPKQLKLLEEIGCDEIQGFLIGRPMPPELIDETLTRHNGKNSLGRKAA